MTNSRSKVVRLLERWPSLSAFEGEVESGHKEKLTMTVLIISTGYDKTLLPIDAAISSTIAGSEIRRSK